MLSLALVASGPKPVHLGNDSFTLARETKKSDPRDCCGGTQCKARCLEEKSFACFLYDDICPSRLSQSIFPEYAVFLSCVVYRSTRAQHQSQFLFLSRHQVVGEITRQQVATPVPSLSRQTSLICSSVPCNAVLPQQKCLYGGFTKWTLLWIKPKRESDWLTETKTRYQDMLSSGLLAKQVEYCTTSVGVAQWAAWLCCYVASVWCYHGISEAVGVEVSSGQPSTLALW